MRNGIQIATIWKVPVRLDLSWFIIFGLVTWSLAGSVLAEGLPGAAPATLWTLGAAASLLFAASVLLHELGHVFFALRNQVPVRGVTLFLFGGVAEITRDPQTPGAELRIAAAGPAVSRAQGRAARTRHTAAMKAGLVPQQPPTKLAPASISAGM